MGRDELKRSCRCHQLHYDGRSSVDLIKRLLQASQPDALIYREANVPASPQGGDVV